MGLGAVLIVDRSQTKFESEKCATGLLQVTEMKVPELGKSQQDEKCEEQEAIEKEQWTA